MHDADNHKGAFLNRPFLNRRDWSTYVVALQNTAPYPMIRDAVRTGQAWFSDGAAQATSWLMHRPPARENLSAG